MNDENVNATTVVYKATLVAFEKTSNVHFASAGVNDKIAPSRIETRGSLQQDVVIIEPNGATNAA